MLPFPFNISPILWAAGIGALVVGLAWLADEIGDRREAKVVARYEERDRKIAEEARLKAEAAIAARESAFTPGALARLRADWCRDCGEAR